MMMTLATVNEAKRQAEAMQRTLTIQTKLDDRKISVRFVASESSQCYASLTCTTTTEKPYGGE